ncbi:MAG: hypothetical protein UV78_C0006G0017 [Parcubacteria group bacterium GW2011_GWA2_43_17]|nr:MAG: hypothetical protein UV78_C0006G0017 [Parcubacteria group bacterium GW2011_GWA2_43_17]OHB42965.1 MAG: hypothetical protein A2Y13_12095 [Planctomycetes bacterium GWC2_45_44]HBR20290.1 hypothetical protein [Phycisphaerales bacterium]
MPEEIKDIIISDSKSADVFLAKDIIDGKIVSAPIPTQKAPVVPNSVFIPQVIIQTGIINGQLRSSAQIVIASANVDDNGIWKQSGNAETIFLGNIAELDSDIAHISKEFGAVYSNLVAIVAEINKIRQVI